MQREIPSFVGLDEREGFQGAQGFGKIEWALDLALDQALWNIVLVDESYQTENVDSFRILFSDLINGYNEGRGDGIGDFAVSP